MKTPEEQLQEIVSTYTNAPDKRICAACLCEVDRASYNAHMQGHGYETLHISELPLDIAINK